MVEFDIYREPSNKNYQLDESKRQVDEAKKDKELYNLKSEFYNRD